MSLYQSPTLPLRISDSKGIIIVSREMRHTYKSFKFNLSNTKIPPRINFNPLKKLIDVFLEYIPKLTGVEYRFNLKRK